MPAYRWRLVHDPRPTSPVVAEAVHQVVTGRVPVERVITARLALSELHQALTMVGDRTTVRTILIPDH